MFFRFKAACLLFHCLLMAVSATRTLKEEFEYRGKHKDPSHWSDLHEKWVACNNGHQQSPIELIDNEAVSKELVPLGRHFNPGRATVTNKGSDITVHWEEPVGGFVVNGTEFFLHQLHWHKPSEHFVNGERFDVEMHMVHLSLENKFAVLTGLYRIGEPDPFLEQMKPFIKEVHAAPNKKVDAGIVDPMDTGLDGSEYYRYMGSLTTPPCSEGVIWTVSKTFKTVSRKQLQMLRIATPVNRPTSFVVRVPEPRPLRLHLHHACRGSSGLSHTFRLQIEEDQETKEICVAICS